MPARAAAASASPLACPTDIAVRALTWNSTRSTATAHGRELGDERVELALRARRAARAARSVGRGADHAVGDCATGLRRRGATAP